MTLTWFLLPFPHTVRNPNGTVPTCSVCHQPGTPDLNVYLVRQLPEPWTGEYHFVFRSHWDCLTPQIERQAKALSQQLVERLQADARRRAS